MQFYASCTTGMYSSFLLVFLFFSEICSIKKGYLQAVCLAACKKLHEMGAFTDMLLPDKGSGVDTEKVEQNDEGDPLPGTARHREFYPEGVANILRVSS